MLDKSCDQLRVNKWDGPSVRNTIDDVINNCIVKIFKNAFTFCIFNEKYDTWTERHTLADGRLLISTIAVGFAAIALIYDYYEPFPKSKPVLATCSITYFILMGVLQLYQWYIEKGTFYQAVEIDPSERTPKRYWKWSSSIKKYDDKYILEAEYMQEPRTGYIKVCDFFQVCKMLFIS
ncbi:unnamed protein product [Brugia pahangi]|uniref:Signal peptidase complex subunit 2 n=1 Tax=Brugia pahangi TaxID=6280 RepID=A0A0N4TCE9_BRUPA|nr:unnamed protein product [Brugia pahangi]